MIDRKQRSENHLAPTRHNKGMHPGANSAIFMRGLALLLRFAAAGDARR